MKGASIWLDFGSGYISATDGTGAERSPLEHCLLYLDDVIVIAPDFRTHLDRLAEVLQRLQQAGLKVKPKKCELLQMEAKYLGHLVYAEGIETDPEKVEATREWPPPTCVRGLQAFLGTAGYYRQYLPDGS